MDVWLWNLKHRKLIRETKAMIRLHLFLRQEKDLKEAEKRDTQKLRNCWKS
jgi:hypothetical protein